MTDGAWVSGRSAGRRPARGDAEGGGRPSARGGGTAGESARTAAMVVLTAVWAGWLAPAPLAAQEDAEEEPPAAEVDPADRPEAAPSDVESIDAIVLALYDVISGPAGEERDWDRFRSLFWPGAVLLPNFPEEGDGPAPMTVEEFVETSREYTREQGFFETELARTVQRYGPVANVFSTYESRNEREEEPFVRGINSIQLVHDGERWWVAHVAWTDEREAGPIPERYGGDGG